MQLDIDAMEFDSNRPIAAPVAGDIVSSVDALLAGLATTPFKATDEWTKAVNDAKIPNDEKMKVKLSNTDMPMDFFSALNAVKGVMDNHKDVYLVNEGANTLDDTRNVINLYEPRHRLDCGTWGVMGVGMGFAIGAAITSGKSVVAIEGDSAFGFDGMEIETICRFKLPVTVVILNNGGIYNDAHIDLSGHGDPSPTTLMPNAHYEKMIEGFGGTPYYATTPAELSKALEAGIASKKPTLICVEINPQCGTESGHIGNLNPKVISNK